MTGYKEDITTVNKDVYHVGVNNEPQGVSNNCDNYVRYFGSGKGSKRTWFGDPTFFVVTVPDRVNVGAGNGMSIYTLLFQGVPQMCTARTLINLLSAFGPLAAFQLQFQEDAVVEVRGKKETRLHITGVGLVKFRTSEGAGNCFFEALNNYGIKVPGSYNNANIKLEIKKTYLEIVIPTRRSDYAMPPRPTAKGALYGAELNPENLTHFDERWGRFLDLPLMVTHKYSDRKQPWNESSYGADPNTLTGKR